MDRYTFVAVIGMSGARVVGEGDKKFLSLNFGIKSNIPDGKGGKVDIWKNVEGTWSHYPEKLVQYLLPKTKVLVDLINPQADVYIDNTGKQHLKIRGSIVQVELLERTPWPSQQPQQAQQPAAAPQPAQQIQPQPQAAQDDLPF